MDLYDVMTEIDTRLRTIAGLRVAEMTAGGPGSISPPIAVQYPPDRINFDLTYGRGSDSYEDHIVAVIVGASARRSALQAIAPFLRGSGASSIKAKLDMTTVAPYASCADLTVGWAELDVPKIGGTDYLAALFHMKIIGAGA
jgi:hypothetical protein